MTHVHTRMLLSHRKKKKKEESKILPFATIWIYLEAIMLNEVSQTEKQIAYNFMHVKSKKQNK